MDVLADITFYSVFPEAQIEKERGVILEEMAMYLDNPDDSLQDEFEAVIYRNHPMGMNILGNRDTVSSFKRKDFISFFGGHLDTRRIVFSCVSNLPVDKFEKLARKYFEVPKKVRKVERKKSAVYKQRETELHRPVKQAKCAIGRDAYPMLHENRIPFYLLVNMLGGPGMNSRLNLSLREKYGFVYSIDAHYIAYTDTGMFAVFFGTDPKQLDKAIGLVQKELNKFCEKPLTAKQLMAGKEQIKGQLAMSEENNLSHMMVMGRSVLSRGTVPTLEEIFQSIDETDSRKLLTIAQEMFDPSKLSYLKMVPDLKK
jgi:predicted Zn-dependent peptidase